MPAYAPPARLFPQPTRLPPGTVLWRCHRTVRPVTCFNPVQAHSHFGGSRFDGTLSDPFPYLYLAAEPATALAEVLLRSLEFGGPACERLIPRARVAGHSLSRLTTVAPLEIIRLVTEEDLAAVAQDSWLLETEGAGYAQTRHWAQALRRNASWAQGMVWQSRRHRPRLAYVLFGDRCGEEALRAEPDVSLDLDTAVGRWKANQLLAGLRAAIEEPVIDDREPRHRGGSDARRTSGEDTPQGAGARRADHGNINDGILHGSQVVHNGDIRGDYVGGNKARTVHGHQVGSIHGDKHGRRP
ncbi:RES family NAD+ phosphorylase [Streptomyces sp. URMC 129]|uniref:RES family NAD+ phosphorylase n=1 Tax=Streptomyces sp. URMC 129 TaxID=3423407 RepID=UPI003F1E2972